MDRPGPARTDQRRPEETRAVDIAREEEDDTSIFENKAGLAEDMRFLASIPEVGCSPPALPDSPADGHHLPGGGHLYSLYSRYSR